MQNNPVGKMGILVMPDTKKFQVDLYKALKGIQAWHNKNPLKIDVELNDKKLIESQKKIEAMSKMSEIEIPVSLDTKTFETQLKKLEALAKGRPIQLPVDTKSTGGGGKAPKEELPNYFPNDQFMASAFKSARMQELLKEFRETEKEMAGAASRISDGLAGRMQRDRMQREHDHLVEDYKALREELNKPLPDPAYSTERETAQNALIARLKEFTKQAKEYRETIEKDLPDPDIKPQVIPEPVMDKNFKRDVQTKMDKALSTVEAHIPIGKIGDDIRRELGKQVNDINGMLNKAFSDNIDTRIREQGRLTEALARLNATSGNVMRDFAPRDMDTNIDVHTNAMQASREIDRAADKERFAMIKTKINHRILDNMFNFVGGIPSAITKLNNMMLQITAVGAAGATAVVGITTFAGSLKELAGLAGLLPGALSALAGMGGILASAFSGVGTAMDAMYENAKGGGGVVRNAKVQAIQVKQANDSVAEAYADLAVQAEESLRRIADAQKTLADAQRNVPLAKLRAVRDVEDAQEKLTKAEAAALKTEKELTKARDEARESLEDLRNELANARLDEDKAAIELQKARERYQAAITDSGTSDSTRNELLYELERAEQTLVDSKDKTEDLTKEQDEAAKKGVEGSEKLADAQKAREEALDAVADAQRDLIIAQEQQAESALDASERVRLAEQGLADARRQQAKDHDNALDQIIKAEESLEMLMLQRTDTQSRAEDAMKALTPAAQNFVEMTLRMKDKLGEVRDIAQENFFAKATAPIEDMVTTLLPQLKTGVGELATVMGEGWGEFATGIKEAFADGDLELLFHNIAEGAKEFNRVLKPLSEIFVDLSVVGSSLFPEIAGGIADATEQFAAFIREARENGSLKKWMEDGIQAFKDLGRLIFGIGRVFGAFNDRAREAGLGSTIASWADSVNGFADALNKEPWKSTLVTIFEGVKGAMDGITAAFGPIGEMLIANAPVIKETMTVLGQTIGQILTYIADIMKDPAMQEGFKQFVGGLAGFVKDLGPAMPQIAETLGRLFGQLGAILPELAPVIVNLIEELFPPMLDLLDKIVDLIPSLMDFFNYLIDHVGPKFEAVLGIVGGIVDQVKGWMEVINGILTGDWKRAWEGLGDIMKGQLDIAGNILIFFLESVNMKDGGKKLIDDLIEGIKEMLPNLKKVVDEGINGILRFFNLPTNPSLASDARSVPGTSAIPRFSQQAPALSGRPTSFARSSSTRPVTLNINEATSPRASAHEAIRILERNGI